MHWMRDDCAPSDRLRDRAREHRLRRAGDVLEERVAAAHEGRDDELDLLALAVDDGLDVVEEPLGDVVGGTQLVSAHAQPPGLGKGTSAYVSGNETYKARFGQI